MEEKQKQPVKLLESGEEQEKVIKLLEERIEEHDNNRKAVQDKLHEICEGLRGQIIELEDRVNKELEEKFTSEDNRLQTALNELRGNRTASALQKAKAELLVEQSYKIIENKEEEDDEDDYEIEVEYEDENDSVKPNFYLTTLYKLKDFNSKYDLTTLYELKAERHIIPELMVMRKPTNVRVAGVNRGSVSVEFTFLNPDEEKVLSDNVIVNPVKYKCLLFKRDNEQEGKEYLLGKDEGNDSFLFTPDTLEAETPYATRVKIVVEDRESEWSDEVAEFTTPEFKGCCVWKKCPDHVDKRKKYTVDGGNPRISTKVNDDGYCTIIGNTPIPLNKVTQWSIKIRKSMRNNGYSIYIGIAPNDINQNVSNYDKCGWYFDCYFSKLCSGPPHNYKDKEYGPRKWGGEYVHTGDSVGVVVDTIKGDLSFALNGMNLGIAYCGIPLDRPLVPCVLLNYERDFVELDFSEATEKVNSSIPVPSNITTKSDYWDTITLTWDWISYATFYHIEVDGSKFWGASTTNSFTKRGLLPETEHSFRVRTVRGSSVSEWSDGAVKGRTLKAPEFSGCVWKECPDDVDVYRKYSVDGGNPRIATKVNGNGYCTIIGSTPIPLRKVTQWNIKVLKSKNNNGDGICIGIAPSDINQNVVNWSNNGWYFNCCYSSLRSGPPHNYNDKAYGPRKENGQYVHTRGSVGVVVDTAKGELSFVLSGVNLGVAYEGIPLDKPLVPCVLLGHLGDSVELDTSEVEENVDSSIPVLSNITTKSTTWDTVTLAWDKVGYATSYQNEVDGSKSPEPSTTNSFTKRGLLPEIEHSFRVRTVRGNSVSEWSGVAKGKILKAPEFSGCVWKECPGDVDDKRKYSVDGRNPRITTKVNGSHGYCTIIGDTYIPLNTVTSWNIKVLKSKNSNGDSIHIGIAPFDINQNNDNYIKCGWYFRCYYSALDSGPPHKYSYKEYGPRKKKGGQYVHTGDSVGVVMDTIKGDLSFVLDGVNLGVAFEGVPLDKPLVPCVILGYQGDSVELII